MIAGALAGCGVTGGQTPESASKALSALPGVAEAEVVSESHRSGLAEETLVRAVLTVDDGFQVADDEALASFLLETAWSVADTKPNSFLSIYLIVPEGQIVDLYTAAENGGWSGAYGQDPENPGSFMLNVDAGEIGGPESLDRLGGWPGDVPVLPDGVIMEIP
ncbi:hypothetical protein D6T64_21560 [Cryobacterium melibiosiphilum]|uniref:Uncharacterized protein n=1 Tax=Cryobacterium melibiosiphilum TaxID=995039 RepID=A0A3A5M7N0_9MICO|nr:hypothetical protein [Cryobacterium melibiosiphilum]RJT84735.1 hypothetical protein D6T64_21560 [Cryobacterium melibiosiphilum]